MANPTVALDVSVDNGATWTPIAGASGLTMDRFGRGSFTWTAGPLASDALIRARSASGATPVSDVSDGSFQIANAGTAYYVNDGSTAGDEFTTAPGNNANDGKTAATPMASLAALLRAYDLDANDVIHLDTGTYNLATNILLEAQDSGVTIRGPQLPGHSAILNRGNTGQSAFQLAGADDVTIERVAITGAAYAVNGSADTDSDRITLDHVAIYGNTYGVYVGSTNDTFTIRDSEVYGNGNVGIQLGSAKGLIQNNLVRNNATGIYAAVSGVSFADGILVTGNEVRNNTTGITVSYSVTVDGNQVHHNTGGGIYADQSPIVRNNVVYSNAGGISGTNGASVIDNRVFGHAGDGVNSGVGIYVRTGTVSGNQVYNNALGVDLASNSTVSGNLIYGNTLQGVRMNGFQSSGNGLFGNTIYQLTGDAVVATGGGSFTAIRDNILVAGAGYALRVGDDTQVGFASNYNLFHTFGTGKLALWEGRDFVTLADWAYETGNDFESFVGDPLFVDANGADGILGFVGGVDGGVDDDFRLSVGSPGVDRGDPLSLFLAEPAFNGGRVDLGAYGNTAKATQSAAQLVQVLNPNGLEKFELGQTVGIDFRSAGLTPYDTVLRLNNGSASGPVEGWSVDRYRTGGAVTVVGQTIATAGVVDAAPAAIYQSWAYANYGTGEKLSYKLPAADGNYRLLLHTFSETEAVGTELFSVALNGTIVSPSVDRRALAGAVNKAVVLAYDVTVTGGQGITVDMTNITNNYGAGVAGIELRRINAGGVPNPTVDLEVSADGGATWIPVAGGITLDRYGRGSFTWNAGPVATGALIRATGHAGAVTVTDVSDAPFQIANAGTSYYVNDASLVGNEYTTAAGNNANDGKTAATPMASLAALLRAYDLDAGDTIYVDTGVYNLSTNIVLTAEDSGVRIRGPVLPTHDAVLDRGNTSSNQRVFSFEGASGVTLEWLNVTGAQNGIEAVGTTGNDNVTLRFMDVYNNSSHGVVFTTNHSDWLIRDNEIHNNGQYGIGASGERSRIEDNEVYGNTQGMVVSSGSEATRSLIIGNDVHDNGSIGINISSYVTASGNRAYNHNGSGDIGIYSYNATSLVTDNDAYNNTIGIQTGYQGWLIGNRSFDNGYGIVTYYSSNISRNQVYSNSIGIADQGYSEIFNNLVYANTNVGIDTTYSHTAGDRTIYNNTVWQATGDAIRVYATANTRIRNNILSVGNGYAINVAADGQAGFSSDWNLFDLTTAAAKVGRWGATERITLTDWRAVSANHDASGKVGDPKFLDINGADNILGDQDVTTGDGYDDNFSLNAGSAAIDAANAYEAAKRIVNYPHDAALRDIEDRQRHDDPSTVDTGIGWDLFVESTPGGSTYSETGTAVPFRTTSGATTIALPFAFSFYGNTYTSVQASVNGFLHFAGPDGASGGDSDTLDQLLRNVRIAPLWDNLRTDLNQSAASGSTPGNIFVDTTVANQITIRWAATRQDTGGGDVNFSVTLFANGNIRFDYGDGNQSLTPTIGLSAGNGFTFVTSAYSGQANLNNAASVLFTKTPGLDYFDIGAYEFLGNSGDTVAPIVTSVSTLPPNNGTTALAFTSLQVAMSEALNSISAKSPANYDLREAGVDNQFDTTDDVIITVRPAYSYPETDLTLEFLTGLGGTPGILSDGEYRLTLSGTKAIFDLSGNPLDGNANGTGGDDYVRFFDIDRTSNIAPVANAQSLNVGEDGSIVVTLSASDANGDALVYSLLGDPAHGTLSEFNPAARTVRYTPTPGYTGPDSFQFRVDDGKAGIDDAIISISVLPINDAPVAANQSVSLDEDAPRLIVLDASDTETTRADLVFTLATAPQFGTLTQGPAGGWTYTPNANYTGADSFTWTVTDRGDPDGTQANAITSAPATVTLTVNAVNDAPGIAAVGDQVVLEGSTLLVDLDATDVEGQVLNWSLDTAPAGMTINATTGVVSWVPADGADVVSVTARVTDAGSPSAFSTVTFGVTAQNVAPTLTLSGAASVDQATPYTLLLGRTDPGADTLANWEINWGDGITETVAGSAVSVQHTYFAGGTTYGITATGTDEDGTFAANALNVSVIAPNTAPVPQSQTVFLDEDTPTVITLNATDVNGDPLTYTIEGAPAFGTLSAVDPVTRQVTFTPTANVRGNDSFTFRVSDGLASAVGTITLKIRPVNDVPVANAATFSPAEGTVLNGQLTGTDVETPGELTFNLVSGPASGTLTLNPDGTFSYDPVANFNGTVSFVFTVTDTGDDELDCGCPLEPSGFTPDGPDTSAPKTVTINVLSVNDPPVAADDAFGTAAGQSLVITTALGVLANDTDVEGNPLAVDSVVDNVDNGTLTLQADGSFTYIPNAGFSGSDQFTYRVTDGIGFDDAIVTIVVTPPSNLPPVAQDESYTVQEGRVLNIAAPGLLANDSDADGDTVTAFQYFQPANGTVSLTQDGSFTYTPNAGFVGTDSFVYVVTDGTATDQATVTITVLEGSPIAGADTYNVLHDRVLTIPAPGLLANDTDPNGDPVTAFQFFQPTSGTVSLTQDGSFIYTPNAGFVGTDSFVYVVTDGVLTGQGTVTINVTNTAPDAVNDAYSVQEGRTLTVTAPGLLANDSDANAGDAVTAFQFFQPGNGTVSLAQDGSFTYTPNAGFSGTDTFNYLVTDGVATDQATVTITVIEGSPIAGADSYTTAPGQALIIPAPGLLANDTDPNGDPVTAFQFFQPANGAVSLSQDGSFTYTPNAGFAGVDAFTYVITDGVLTGSGTVTITVAPPNNAPPVLGPIADVSVGEGAVVEFDVSVSDPDHAVGFVYELVAGPVGASLDAVGHFSWSAPEITPGAPVAFTVRVTDPGGASDQQSFEISVTPRLLRVTDFGLIGQSSFHVRFNRPLDPTRINLYDSLESLPGQAGAGDLRVLVGNSTIPIRGSLLLDADKQGFTFVRSGGVFGPGGHSVRLYSRADGWTDAGGRPLDGDALLQFTGPAAGPVLSLPDFIRGPGQDIRLPNHNTTGIRLPVSVGAAAGLQSLSLRLDYDPALLSLSAVELASGLTGSATLSGPEGARILTVNLTAPLSATGTLNLLNLSASVPASAPYGQTQRIQASILSTNLATLKTDDALQVVGYLGDATGNAGYSAADVAALQRVSTGLANGFGAWALTDPVIVADLVGPNVINFFDTQRLLTHLNTLGTLADPTQGIAEIPRIPVGGAPISFAGPDPLVSVGANPSARPGETVRVPITLDTAAGLNSALVRVAFDPAVLELVGIARGTLTGEFDWLLERRSAGLVVVDMAKLLPLTQGTGSLIELEFRIKDSAPVGDTPIDLQYASLNDTRLTLNPPPLPGLDPTDGRVSVMARVEPAVSTATVNWSGSLPSISLPPAGTPEPKTASSGADWMNAPWARDLSERLTSTSAQSESSRAVLPGRELLRALSRVFARR